MAIAAHFEEFSDPADREPIDRARDPRRMLRLEAEGLTGSGDSAPVRVHNISASGLLLESEVSLAPGERIDVDLPHAGKTAARVVWASGSFFGCQFEGAITAAALSAAQLRSDVPELRAPSGESFGMRLQRLRKQRGMTMSQLAVQLGVSKPTVWAWEQGKARPVEARMAALAHALDVSAEDMLIERSVPALPGLIAKAKEQIAGALGVLPEKVKIVVDL
jgi:transcriptional regulator with XRE-family HTH domain